MGLPIRKEDAHYTYQDYCKWPDDERWELIDGVAYNMCAAPSLNHQLISGDLGVDMFNFQKGKPCRVLFAAVDVFFPRVNEMDEDDVDTVVQPDLVVVCDEKKLRPKGVWGAPDLLVEILSPSTQRKDLREKFDLYQRSGVREYWVIDPRGEWVQQYVLAEDGLFGPEKLFDGKGTVNSVVMEGFSFEVADLWKNLVPKAPS